mgnify:CR=1 FL=1|jgi:hypothetical protein
MPADKGLRSLKDYDPFGNYINPDSPEFEAKVRSNIPDAYRYLVDKNKAAGIKDPTKMYSTLGLNVSDADVFHRLTQFDSLSKDDVKKLSDESKHVYGIGLGASPLVYAHEFQHDKIDDEFNNRLALLTASNSPESYWHNINDVYNWYVMNRATHSEKDPKTGKHIPYKNSDPFKQKEEAVLNSLNAYFRARDMNGAENILGKGNYPPNTDLHREVNQNWDAGKDPPRLWTTYPMDYLKGNTRETSKGVLPRTMIEERAKFPYLNFVGSDPGPITSGYRESGKELRVQYDPEHDPRPKDQRPYKRGGSVERTTRDRKIL